MANGVDRVLVIGGGIGGLAAAIALGQRGIAVDMIEIGPEWKVYGAGLTMTGPTLRAFRDLGLFDAIAEKGYFSIGGEIYLFNGTLLSASATPPIEPNLPAAGGIMRPELHKIMVDRARSLGTNVKIGVTADSFVQSDDRVQVLFSDGTDESYPLVIGADGIYSKTRELIFGADAAQPVYTGQMSWRVVAPRPPEMNVSHFYFGHPNVGGIIPSSETEVYAFVLHPAAEPLRVPKDEQSSYLKGIMGHFGGFMGEIRDGITAESSIVPRPFEYMFQPTTWHVGRVLLIGDAAHSTTPHLASGAGMAVEDALVLADELEAHADVPTAIAAFEQRRYDRCKFVVDSSVGIAKRQLENAPAEEIGMRMGEAMGRLAQPI